MNISRNNAMSIALAVIIMVVLSVIAFLLPFTRSSTFFIGYFFAMLANVLTIGVIIYSLGRGNLKSKFYGMPLIFVVWSYLAIQVIVSFIQMLFPFIPPAWAIVINIILLGICFIGLIAVTMGKEAIIHTDEKVKEKVFYIKSLQIDVEGLAFKANDGLKKSINNLADAIRYSDPMSSPQLSTIENQIDLKINMLKEAVGRNDDDSANALISELNELIAERSRKCKMLK